MATGTEIRRRRQRGVVLLMALVALLLISAVGAALLYMTTTESALVGGQRSITRAYTAALGGLEEGKARLATSDPTFLGGTSLAVNFPDEVGDVLYILNPASGETVQPWVLGDTFYDWEYVTEFGANIETVAPCAVDPFLTTPATPCGWSVNSDLVAGEPLAGLPEIPYKWIRITILTEQAANRDIDGSGGALDNVIPVTWDSASNRMNIINTAGTDVDRDGNGVPESDIDTDGDGTVDRNERLGRYVYRITAMSLLPLTGATRMVQFDVSAPFINLGFPSAVSLIGPTSTCGPTLGCDSTVMGTCDSPMDWGPSNALESQGNDQADVNNDGIPENPADGGPAIGCTDPATCDDCKEELLELGRADNWSGIDSADCDDGDPDTPCTGNISGSAGVLGDVGGLQFLVDSIRNVADQVLNTDTANNPVDAPPQTDGNAGNDEVDASGADLGTCVQGGVNNPKITVIDGDVDLGSSGGCGVLLVTGSLEVSGSWEWKGIILVIGEGSFEAVGTPSMQGAQVVARIYCQDDGVNIDPMPCPCAGGSPAGQCSADGVLAQPEGGFFGFNGGGSGGWDYNSMWINNATGSANYQVLAYREISR